MPGPIDDALKHLTELSPRDWVVRGGWPAATAALIDADIGTISGAADKAIHVSGSPDWLRGEPFDVALRYRVLRVWEVPATTWLSGGLGLVPLAPLGIVQKADLPAIVTRMKQRFDHEAPNQTKELWSGTYLLMGLRYESALVQTLLRGVVNMKESSTYQAILEEGEAIGATKGEAKGKTEEARKMLLLLGRNQFGEPSAKIVALLDAVTDLGRLEELMIRLLRVKTWEDLLSTNGTTRHPRGRKKA